MSQHRKFYKPTPISLPQKDLLQLACTYGDLPLIQSLLKSGEFNVNDRDQESNCTALHSSVYHRLYGVSALLTAYGAKWEYTDFDGCSVWDYLNDSREHCQPINDKCLVYSWGNNFTWNLGIETGVTKHTPSPVKGLERANIKNMIVSKYHSLFLDKNGEVYSCGIGEGGRLGHGNEETYLSFTHITSLNDKIIDICAGNGHSLFLSEQGCIFSCGINDNGQLGIGNSAESIPTYSLFPTKLNHKDIRNKFFSFIACGNYHSVFCTERKIYTFGCNFGQLGYSIGTQGDIQYIPKVVNAFTLRKDSKFVALAATDNVTVGLLSNNSILVCANFKCTFYSANKTNLGLVYSLSFSFIQISVYGKITSTEDNLEKSRTKYNIFLLDSLHSLWRFSDQNNSIQLCRFEKGYDLKLSHLALGNTLFLVTLYGEVFQCQLPSVHFSDLSRRPVSTLSLVEKSDLEESANPIFSLSRFDFLYNILNFYTDPECDNFFVSLLDPNTHLELLPRIQNGTYRSDLKTRFELIQDNPPKDCIAILSEGDESIVVDSYFFYSFLSSFYLNPPKSICDFPFSFSDKKYKSTLNYKQLHDILETAYHQRNECPKETAILFTQLHSQISSVPKYKTQLISPKLLNLHIFPELHDTIINSIDGESFKCHKCVLISRSEYFASMLSFGWQESSSNLSTLNLHFSLVILRIVIEYIYSDRFPNSIQEQTLYQLLIASDLFLLPRLKDWSESKLSLYLSVDNVVPVLELSSMYNAQQLLITCIEFICINFGWLISKRELELLDLDVLNLISDCAQTRARRKEMPDRIAYQHAHYPSLVEEFLSKGPPKELNRKSTPKEIRGKKNSRLNRRSESGKRYDSYSSNRSTSEGSQTTPEQEVSPSTTHSAMPSENWKPKWLNSETNFSEAYPILHFNDILEEERSILDKKSNSTRILLKHNIEPHQDFEEQPSKFSNHLSWGIACNHLKRSKQKKIPNNSTSESSSENVPKKERTWLAIESPQNISFDDIYRQQRISTDPAPLYPDPSSLHNDEIPETPLPNNEDKIQTNSPKINDFQSIVIEEQVMLELQQYYASRYPFELITIEREFGNEHDGKT